MTASEFDKLVKNTRMLIEERNQSPQNLEDMLLERLQTDKYTYDGTILDVMYTWRNYESAFDWCDAETPYPQTRRLVDALFEYTDQRPMLHAMLSTINGEIFHEFGQLDSAAAAYIDAVDDLHEMHLDVDSKRIYSMMTLGHLLLSQGNKQDAEKLFLDVLSYPWYLVMEADLQSVMRQYYIKAGLGLIECRRGNLAALQEIFFVPATQGVLSTELELALEEAKGEPDQ